MPRDRKPSSKFQFMEEANAAHDAEQARLAKGAPERKAKAAARKKAKKDAEKAKIAAAKAKLKAKRKPKKKKSKASKGDGPKRPRSGYIYFCKAQRDHVIRGNPDASFGQVGTILGEWWTNCSEQERSQYMHLADKDKRRYEREVAEGGGRKPRAKTERPKKVKAAKPVKRKKAIKTWNNKDGKKSYYNMICEAIIALKERGGSSGIAIEKWIVRNYDEVKFARHVFRASLATHTKEGRLERIRNSWKLSKDEKKLAIKRQNM